MENQETNINLEFEELRREYSTLKQEIAKQNTLNEKLIMSSIRKDLRAITSKKYMSIMAAFIAIPLIIILSLDLNFRLPFIIISVTWMLAMCVGNFIRFSNLSIDSLFSSTTQTFLEEMKQRKTGQFRWVRIHFSILVLWVGYFIGELIHTGLPKDELLPMIGGCVLGLAIGLTIGLKVHNRIIGAYEGIILELENPEASHSIL